MGLTTDVNDECIKLIRADGMQECYLILPEEERAKGFIRPVRQSYKHLKCGVVTHMALALAETYAHDPSFYGGTYCVGCKTHFPLREFKGEYNNVEFQFSWEPEDGSFVGE